MKQFTARHPWAILAAGAAIQILTGLPAAWGVFQQPVMDEFSLTEDGAGYAFGILIAAFGVGCVIGGFLQDKKGPRCAALWGTGLLCGGFFAAALLPGEKGAWFWAVPGTIQEHNGIIRHGAKIVYAYAEATVPKVTLITRKAYGGAYIVMSSKPTGADVNLAYPQAEIAVMGAAGAVNILYRKSTPEEKQEIIKDYEDKFSNPYCAAERGLIDEVIMPRDTRYKLIQALEMCHNKNQSNPPKKHGNMPL